MKLRNKFILSVCFIALIGFWFILPKQLFNRSYSAVAYSKEGELLGARIANDGQWRFPELKEVPEKYKAAILVFEDERFHYHPGVDPIAILRAIVQNVRAGKVESGASTITMQVMRLSRNKPRTIKQKTIEAISALRLELTLSKDEILALHSSHAPYGLNIVGLDAACWRYFGKSPNKLSWAQAALLAVLPNAPSLMHPGKNRTALKFKRNRLLKKLWKKGYIDDQDYLLAIEEIIPEKPKPLPSKAYHLVEQLKSRGLQKSTIDIARQNMLYNIANERAQAFGQHGIENLAALIADTETGEILAYIGNSSNTSSNSFVDMIHAERSSGSILKPLLHAFLLDEGLMTPKQLLPDVPISFSGFNPSNFSKKHTGANPADEALASSLNIPAVQNLQTYGVDKFLNKLKAMDFESFHYPAEHYGLSLILGGAEVNLWDLASTYAYLGRTLKHYTDYDSQYLPQDFHKLTFEKYPVHEHFNNEPQHLHAGAIWHTFEAMTNLNRPNEDGHWESFASSGKIAWKTGTSFGFRDAWAVGVTPRYTIATWVGNADGEGRKENIGSQTAGRFLFDIFNRLPRTTDWFEMPLDDMHEMQICKTSGHLASAACDEVDSTFVFNHVERTKPCPYHHKVFIKDGHQVNSSCANLSEVVDTTWFSLPPAIAYYYKKEHPSYQELPAFEPSCKQEKNNDLAFIYPTSKEIIYLPTDLDGEKQKLVCRASHSNPKAELFWHVNERFIGTTKDYHTVELDLKTGEYEITIIDLGGNQLSQQFEVIGADLAGG